MVEDIDDLAGLSRTNPVHGVHAGDAAVLARRHPAARRLLRQVLRVPGGGPGRALWLAVIGVLASVVGAYYYLRIIKIMYFDEPVGALRSRCRPNCASFSASAAPSSCSSSSSPARSAAPPSSPRRRSSEAMAAGAPARLSPPRLRHAAVDQRRGACRGARPAIRAACGSRAGEQTAGAGRRGRAWTTGRGNLAASLAARRSGAGRRCRRPLLRRRRVALTRRWSTSPGRRHRRAPRAEMAERPAARPAQGRRHPGRGREAADGRLRGGRSASASTASRHPDVAGALSGQRSSSPAACRSRRRRCFAALATRMAAEIARLGLRRRLRRDPRGLACPRRRRRRADPRQPRRSRRRRPVRDPRRGRPADHPAADGAARGDQRRRRLLRRGRVTARHVAGRKRRAGLPAARRRRRDRHEPRPLRLRAARTTAPGSRSISASPSPHADLPGVDLVFPDISYLEEERTNLAGIVITHAHEDHFGALIDLWPRLARAGLRHRLHRQPACRQARQRARGARAVPITRGRGRRPHQGRPVRRRIHQRRPLDPRVACARHPHAARHRPPQRRLEARRHADGRRADRRRPAARRSARRACSRSSATSTNAMREGRSPSETEVGARARRDHRDTPGAGRLHHLRLQRRRASSRSRSPPREAGRDVVVVGRAMRRVIDVAARARHARRRCRRSSTRRPIAHLPRDKVVALLTGSQGEPRAALARVASRRSSAHRADGRRHAWCFRRAQSPATRSTINAIINALTARGVRVITDRDRLVHVSGHPRRGRDARDVRLDQAADRDPGPRRGRCTLPPTPTLRASWACETVLIDRGRRRWSAWRRRRPSRSTRSRPAASTRTAA